MINLPAITRQGTMFVPQTDIPRRGRPDTAELRMVMDAIVQRGRTKSYVLVVRSKKNRIKNGWDIYWSETKDEDD